MWFFSRKSRRGSKDNTPRPRCRPQLESMEDRSVPSAGLLDPTFGSDGVVTTTFGGRGNGDAWAVFVQPDGKIVATGREYGVARYNPNGSLDTSFGSGGKATTNMNGGLAFAAALYPPGSVNGGKIILAGSATTTSKGNVSLDFGLIRYNANGTLDTSFGNKGKVVTDFGGTREEIEGVALQPDGKVVVAGSTFSSTVGRTFALARYNNNGTLDTSFGSGGKVSLKIGSDDWFTAVAIQPDGKIVATGFGTNQVPYQYTEIVVARFTSNGSLDTNPITGFGSLDPNTGNRPGWASPYLSGSEDAYALALQPDGKIVVAGRINPIGDGFEQFLIARFNLDGSMDSAFGSAGKVMTQVYGWSWAWGLGLQSDGKIVAAGTSNATNENLGGDFHGFALARYNVDGSLDDGSPSDSTPGDSFGTAGISVTNIVPPGAPESSGIRAVAFQPDGKVVAAGFTSSGFTVARYLTAEPQIGTFTASSYSVPPGTSVTLTAANIADANPGSTVTQVTFYYFDANGDKVNVTGIQTSPGVWTASLDTSGWGSGHYTVYAAAQDSYGVFGDPVGIDLEVI